MSTGQVRPPSPPLQSAAPWIAAIQGFLDMFEFAVKRSGKDRVNRRGVELPDVGPCDECAPRTGEYYRLCRTGSDSVNAEIVSAKPLSAPHNSLHSQGDCRL